MLPHKIILFVTILHNYEVYASKSCATKMTCQQCITDPSVCVWCAEDDFKGIRCQPAQNLKSDWCPGQVQSPNNTVLTAKDLNFSSDSGNVTQIKPQQYKMKLRPGIPEQFTFSFKGAKNYPVDLYFLLDASLSMAKTKNDTAYRSKEIYGNFTKMTDNVRLGFGTFVDKLVLPFSYFQNNDTTYSFHHHLSLIDNFTEFHDTMLKIPNGVNADTPEGGLDALAQVMACKDLIGWRNESRKIIIFMTNAPYHAAGDGKSGGLFQPYDGLCYSQSGTYTKEQEMDYPSVGMINKLADENNMIVIFLVEELNAYVSLSKAISGAHAKRIQGSIVTTLKEIYEEISKDITIKTKMNAKNLMISFDPDCTSLNTKSKNSSLCSADLGHEKKFVGTVKLLKYDGQDKIDVDILIEGIGEKLTIDIDVIKKCDCEDKIEEKSSFCFGEKRSCGLCDCGTKRYGERCACLKTEKTSNSNTTSMCIPQGTTEICNGRGSCKCGTCRCRDGYDGKFCECNSQSCERDTKGLLCSGHGDCSCGQCICEERWTGKACDCYDDPSLCVDKNGMVCNNRGRCECGGCKCNPIGTWDARNHEDKFCKLDPCPDCHILQCRTLESCAKCIRRSDECYRCHEQIQTRVVENLPKEYLNSTTWHICDGILVTSGCYSSFAYRYIDENYTLELVAQQSMDCVKNYLLFGGLSLLILVLVGLITLITWKLMTDYRDRKEYLEFTEKNKNAEKISNPLYTAPSTTFDNPGYRKRSFK